MCAASLNESHLADCAIVPAIDFCYRGDGRMGTARPGTGQCGSISDDDDCPDAGDRETAARIIEEIALNDVVTRGSFVLEGHSAARRIARALTAARADERRRGFETPMPMRRLVAAPGAPAVMAKWPGLRPLYHWQIIEGVRFQSYRIDSHRIPLISDDARISVQQHGDVWIARVNGAEVIDCGLVRRFNSEVEAVQAVMAKLR